MGNKRSSFPGLLAMCNLILLIASTILIFLGSALVIFYHLDKLNFVNTYFTIVPYTMIGLGVASFVTSLFGAAIAVSDSRPSLIVFSALMVVLFLTQLYGVFAAMELRAGINSGVDIEGADVGEDLKDYQTNAATMHRWDTLQREFHCCGGLQFNTGFKDWRNSDIGIDSDSVPDTCCHEPLLNCGRGVLAQHSEVVNNNIYRDGCLTVIKDKLIVQVEPVLLGYAVVGTCLALLQLLAVVFACAYSAQISRRKNADLQYDDGTLNRSTLRSSSTYRAEAHSSPSTPMTPRFDNIRAPTSHYVNGNMFINDESVNKKYMDSESTSDMAEREV
jgi:hypothetical protein